MHVVQYANESTPQYPPWVEYAGMKIFIHAQSEVITPESVFYVIGPGYHTTLGLKYVRW